jgi:hypothetical protein
MGRNEKGNMKMFHKKLELHGVFDFLASKFTRFCGIMGNFSMVYLI